MCLGPLTSPRSRRQVLGILDAYKGFWAQPKFETHVAAPPFHHNDISDLLRRAAEIVVYIRRHIDAEGEPVIWVAAGGAHEVCGNVCVRCMLRAACSHPTTTGCAGRCKAYQWLMAFGDPANLQDAPHLPNRSRPVGGVCGHIRR